MSLTLVKLRDTEILLSGQPHYLDADVELDTETRDSPEGPYLWINPKHELVKVLGLFTDGHDVSIVPVFAIPTPELHDVCIVAAHNQLNVNPL